MSSLVAIMLDQQSSDHKGAEVSKPFLVLGADMGG